MNETATLKSLAYKALERLERNKSETRDVKKVSRHYCL